MDTLVSHTHPHFVLERRIGKYGHSCYSLSSEAREVIQGLRIVKVVPSPTMLDAGKNLFGSSNSDKRNELNTSASIGRFGNDADSIKLYHYLLQVREEEAKKKGVAPYMVFENASVEQMALVRPTDAEVFRRKEMSIFLVNDLLCMRVRVRVRVRVCVRVRVRVCGTVFSPSKCYRKRKCRDHRSE